MRPQIWSKEKIYEKTEFANRSLILRRKKKKKEKLDFLSQQSWTRLMRWAMLLGLGYTKIDATEATPKE